MYKIIETKPGEENFDLFEKFPGEIYPADSLRLKQADSLNYEYLYACLLLMHNNKVQARLAIYNNPQLKYENKNVVCVGNFECINDVNVANEILNYSQKLAKDKLNANYVIGPMNGSTWDNYRYSASNDTPLFFLEPEHHLYYNNLFVKNGFALISKYISSIDKQMHCNAPEILQREKQLIEQGVSFNKIDLNDYENELKKIYQLSVDAFKSNFLYTPISWETFKAKYISISKFINPEYVIIAHDMHKNAIGFIFCIDDLYNRTEKSLIIKTLARVNKKEYSGLGNVLGDYVIRNAVNNNYKSIIHAFMIEHAASSKLSVNYAGEIFKNYTLYGKSI